MVILFAPSMQVLHIPKGCLRHEKQCEVCLQQQMDDCAGSIGPKLIVKIIQWRQESKQAPSDKDWVQAYKSKVTCVGSDFGRSCMNHEWMEQAD